MSDKRPPAFSGFVQVLDGPKPPRLLWEDEVSDKALIERVRLIEADHGPDGWPAVQTKLLSELRDAIARLTAERDAARREAMEECARILDAEHERRKHLDNHAKVHANMIRAAMREGEKLPPGVYECTVDNTTQVGFFVREWAPK